MLFKHANHDVQKRHGVVQNGMKTQQGSNLTPWHFAPNSFCFASLLILLQKRHHPLGIMPMLSSMAIHFKLPVLIPDFYLQHLAHARLVFF